MAKKKQTRAAAKIPMPANITPQQKQQFVDMYRALRKHFSTRKKDLKP